MWVFSLIAIIFVLYLLAKNNTTKESDQKKRYREILERKREALSNHEINLDNTPVLVDKPTESEASSYGLEPDVFYNDWGGGAEDYSYLTPGQARYELKSLKELGYVEWETYTGLMDAIAAGKDEKYLQIVEDRTPEEVEKWFNKNVSNDIKMSTDVWIEVGNKLAPYHEESLISEMYNTTEKTIKMFVSGRKRAGYFFSEKAYKIANDIYYNRDKVVIKKIELVLELRKAKANINKATRSHSKAIEENDPVKIERALNRIEMFQRLIDELNQTNDDLKTLFFRN